MANQNHVDILNQGVEVWNQWREDNPKVRANFREAKLRGKYLRRAELFSSDLTMADLSETNLSRANLSGADLNRVNFQKANLRRADLSGADLSGADLRDANLRRADLYTANLTGANLSRVNLSRTDLFRANLREANLKSANFKNTLLVDTDLRNVENIEDVSHRGPSYIDISTIIRSRGNIPESFLRGCGISDNIIEYIESLPEDAPEYYSCFISYSSKDQDFADRLYADLQNNGVRCWFAPEDMKIGDKIRDRIDQSIRIHDKLLLVLSEHSINSEWVEDEGESAYEQEKNRDSTVLFPIRLDDAIMDTEKAWAAKLRRSRHVGDFTNWKDHDFYQNAFDRLLNDLKAERE